MPFFFLGLRRSWGLDLSPESRGQAQACHQPDRICQTPKGPSLRCHLLVAADHCGHRRGPVLSKSAVPFHLTSLSFLSMYSFVQLICPEVLLRVKHRAPSGNTTVSPKWTCPSGTPRPPPFLPPEPRALQPPLQVFGKNLFTLQGVTGLCERGQASGNASAQNAAGLGSQTPHQTISISCGRFHFLPAGKCCGYVAL